MSYANDGLKVIFFHLQIQNLDLKRNFHIQRLNLKKIENAESAPKKKFSVPEMNLKFTCLQYKYQNTQD